MTKDEEFEKIRAAIESATDVLAGAIEKYGACEWDYMIVAVPQASRNLRRVALMASVMPEQLPKLLEFLHTHMKSSEVPKVVEINGVPEGSKPS